MKVTVCPICQVTPEITNTKLTCPKCGRTAVGEYLEDTVTKWNDGKVTTGKPEAIPEEVPEVEPEIENEPEVEVKPVEEEKPKKAPVRRTVKKTVKKEGK